MIVAPSGILGTIGGGTLEWQACALAQKMRERGSEKARETFVLGPDLGQCCGGRVTLDFQLVTSSKPAALDQAALELNAPKRQVMIFGAGHVGKALVLALAQTDLHVDWIDPRPDAFPGFHPANVQTHNDVHAEAHVSAAAPGAIVFVMSHSHALDLAIVDAALRNANVAAVGLIGSATKKARFLSRLQQAGVEAGQLAKLICPIGIDGIRSKRPAAIAISTAAQILALDEALGGVETWPEKQQGAATAS
jgi:xanthine dehydrogenase accessory factor